MSITATENKINEYFEKLVPSSGKADTVAGEIIRAISRIGYRNYNDGDHIGVGYGKETCNPAARYLLSLGDPDIEDAVNEIWGVYDDKRYDELLHQLEKTVLEYIEAHPELEATENDTDMHSFRTSEDVDDDDEDEDW